MYFHSAHAHTHTCTSLCTHMCTSLCTCAHVYFTLHMHTCTSLCTHVCTSLHTSCPWICQSPSCTHAHMHTCTSLCTYTRGSLHTNTHTHTGLVAEDVPQILKTVSPLSKGSPGLSGWALNREGLHPKLSALCLSPGGSPGLRAILPVKDSKAGGCSLARGRRHTRQGPARSDGRAGGQHCPEQRRGTNRTSHGGTHRSAVVVPENLLVEVVKELLLQLEHHLLGVGRQSRGPLPRAGPRRGGERQSRGGHGGGGHQSRGPLPRAGPQRGLSEQGALPRAGPWGEGQSRGPPQGGPPSPGRVTGCRGA